MFLIKHEEKFKSDLYNELWETLLKLWKKHLKF